MTVELYPYWMRRPSKAVMDRLAIIASLTQNTVRTVRNITYKLYPDLHGKALDVAYNRTIKDVVRGRIMGLVPWQNIRESRIEFHSPNGYESQDSYVKSLIDENFWKWYRRSRRPAHLHPIECWFEKTTVEPEFAEVCGRYDIPYLSTRGQFPWTAKKNSDRLTEQHLILYFGDRDEKGQEIRDVIKRDLTYLGIPCNIEWVAVTPEQEQRFGLPSGARLDGFELEDLKTVIEEAIQPHIDQELYNSIIEEEEREIEELRRGRLVFERGET